MAKTDMPGLAMTMSGLFGLVLTPLGKSSLHARLPSTPAQQSIATRPHPTSTRIRDRPTQVAADIPDILVKGPLGGSYTGVNVVLLVLGFVSTSGLAWRVWRYTKRGVRLEDGDEEGSEGEEGEDEDED
jgi:hypothetical protein